LILHLLSPSAEQTKKKHFAAGAILIAMPRSADVSHAGRPAPEQEQACPAGFELSIDCRSFKGAGHILTATRGHKTRLL